MSVQPKADRRPYKLNVRARRQAETRRRITEATVELHGTAGPARTTISAIAERAGVERLTVYRHFPDERSLLVACSSHWIAAHPPPDPLTWAATKDVDARLRSALAEIYGYYEANERMLSNNTRDAAEIPVLAELMGDFAGYLAAVHRTLMRGRRSRGRRRTRVMAALGHALDFEAWRSLRRRQGLEPEDAIELMVGLTRAAVR